MTEMTNYVEDMKMLFEQSRRGDWDYWYFLIRLDCDGGPCLGTLKSRTVVADINKECLKTKPIYECVEEVLSELSFDDVLDQLLEGFVEALDNYVGALNDILGNEYDQ
ncbi:MAG: hypothetical protein LM558_00045 [Thermosphaera sp.]|nr:hypothetical protein [Thermosphaera sp.]